jgi:hypothetical protein
MSEIKIIDFMPVVLTKDVEFINQWAKTWKIKPGAIMVLPEDAILIKLTSTQAKGGNNETTK